MRNFIDCWQFLFTNGGKPLVGKIEFCEANTTSLKTIYDVDGQELDNPIYVDGVTDYQVMLEGDYTARFYEYIGDGIMVGDTAPEHWKLFKTELLKGESETTVIEDGAIIDTIDDLKNINGMHNGDCVEVLGYYTKEDCPARFYVWHESGQWADDGGVWIKSNNTTQGAWIMKIPGSYIDVRWYGDIPNSTTAATTTHMGTRAYAAAAANRYHKDLYFPSYNGGAIGYYIFDGSNTVSVQKDIILDNGVRFVVKKNTSGTLVSCHEMKACDDKLFIPELNQTIGSYTLEADWINTGWYWSNIALCQGARVGYIVENMHGPLTIDSSKVKLVEASYPLTLRNCEVVEGHKILNNSVTLYNMVVKTDWFDDSYAYTTDLHLYNDCKITLDNCKDANTYIILKNIAGDHNYGDLGEQSINATVYSGGTIENCYGTITVADSSGNIEFHNVSLTVNGLTANHTINAVDSWLTFGAATILSNIQLRRGSLAGPSLTLVSTSLIDNSSINLPINTTGAKLTVRNSEIYGQITTRNIELINNQIYAVIDQADYAGVITVLVSGNMFHGDGVHYVHATQSESVVNGIWISNGSTYSDKHWIRLDRTNLKYQDIDHHYSYIANAEPYLDQWNGRNRPMSFKMYSGHWTDSQSGTGIFATTTIPFVFMNDRELSITVVPRQNFWRMFTVGRGFLCRSGQIKVSCNAGEVGIMEGDYNDHTNGCIVPVFNWGCGSYTVQKKVAADGTTIYFEDYPDSTKIGCIQCVCRDADGIAEYECSFEGRNVEHGQYSYGMQIGSFPSHQWNGAQNGTGGSYGGSLNDKWVKYPATSYQLIMYVFIDKDFSTGSNPQNVFS